MKPCWLSLATAAGVAAIAVTAPAGPPPDAGGQTPAQAARAEQRADDAWSRLAPREKKQVLRLYRALRNMPPEERALLHRQLERFRQMTPEDREQLRRNRERWKQMTPAERERARRLFRQRHRRLDEQWRREHPGEEWSPQGSKPAGDESDTETATQPSNEEKDQE